MGYINVQNVIIDYPEHVENIMNGNSIIRIRKNVLPLFSGKFYIFMV